ncbi:phospholipid-transporting ATPase ABCA3-like [Rhipicephalus sanguineus]|uniref:phospholipid-transporting ATPase ABCA3-like n=1 Tax=Rhipicephalus sanguineus TaxID=34632 RepID=UPI0018957FE1|nr:phospholipid-transporting ATPase ABCA3-like [Rhipicephalus sanguineus]
MVIYGVFTFLYLLYRVSERPSRSSLLPKANAAIPKDEDVAAEWTAVEEICLHRNFFNNSLVAQRLHKNYGALHVVKELSLALRPAECFGLLGVNGAGKTTTFRMLTALTPMTYGEAYMREVVLSEEPRKWQSGIGYCPQGDALLGKLNAYENLYLFGRLRGVPEESLPDVVSQIIEVTDLQEHAAKRCDYYSGGNKRKLSIAIALVGLPGVVFLDEPYAGVDVLARTRIYIRLTGIKEQTKCSMVLTSHSMEECEVACDRICIMVQGTMVCLGTLQHLKDKFGKGCSIKFLLHDNANMKSQQILEAVGKVFPGMKILNITQEQIEIRTREKLPWSVLFHHIEYLDKDIGFERVLASDTTLEQLFIEFAEKGQNEESVHSV